MDDSPTMRVLVLTARGAFGFGLAAALTFGTFDIVLMSNRFPMSLGWPLMFIIPFLAGAAASWIVLPNQSGTASSGAFGCGFVVIWAAVSFAHISIQGGGRPEFGWAALAGGVSFAIAGAAGGATVDSKLLVPAALFFGTAGAVGTMVSFYLTTTPFARWGVIAAMSGAGIVAGAMFGAYLGFAGLDEPRSRLR